ncbi:MAG TPA: HEPN domain-containing protein [Solimonas sp.]|nr:HEPN domain-containing protein [Solimonas sp.]
MSVARNNFLQAYAALSSAFTEPVILDVGMGATPHNERARLLRNGLAVMTFSALEGFIRSRSLEILRDIRPNLVPLANLPEGIQKHLTVSVIEGLSNKVRYMKTADAISIIQAEAAFLGSVDKQTAYGFSDYSFGRDKSNVSGEDIKALLAALGVNEPWEAIRHICIKANFGGITLVQEQYKKISLERHAAAHVASHQVAATTLADHARNAYAIALGFDVLASAAKTMVNSRTRPLANAPFANAIGMFTIQPVSPNWSTWRVTKHGSARAVKVCTTLSDAEQVALSRTGDTDAVVVLDRSGTPQSWIVH